MSGEKKMEHAKLAYELEIAIIVKFTDDDYRRIALTEALRAYAYQVRLAALAEASDNLSNLYGFESYQHDKKKKEEEKS